MGDNLDPRVRVVDTHGVAQTMVLDPGKFESKQLAAALADAWVRVTEEMPGNVITLTSAIKEFVSHVDGQPRSAGTDVGLTDLRRRHLDAWEADQLRYQRSERSDTRYRHVVHMLALLRRIEDDDPGSLHPEVVRRLESGSRLPHIRRPGEPAYSPKEIRAIRGEAHRQVYRALLAHRKGQPPALAPDLTVALHVLWSLSTGEPPEVVRGVTLDDIEATAGAEADAVTRDMSRIERLHYLAERDLVETFAVRFFKARTGERYQCLFDRAQKSQHRAIVATILLGQSSRIRLGNSALWVTDYPNRGTSRTIWTMAKLSTWVARYLPTKEISQPVNFRRLRKTLTTREALADPVRYLRDGRRHTARTFFDHYTNSTVLRAHAGRVLMDSINEAFDAAVGGPTVILPEAENLISGGTPVQLLTPEEIEALKRGELETPMAACRDPLDSPHGQEGHPCPVATTGDCFACPNALILRRHLPAALRLAELTHPDRAANIEVWSQRWRMVHETLTQAVLPAFSEDDIADATAHTDEVLLDPTLINDLGEAG